MKQAKKATSPELAEVKTTTETNPSSQTETAPQAANDAPQGAQEPPAKPAPKKGASRKASATKAKDTAKAGKPKLPAKKSTKPAGKLATPRETKGSKVLEMLARPKGATLTEIMKATGWQKHTVRGWISIANRKPGVSIRSARNEKGERVYSRK